MVAPVIIAGSSVSAPGSAPTAAAGSGSGSLSSGNYYYAVSYLSPFGETLVSANSNTINAAANSSMSLTAIPTSSSAQVYARNIYRVLAGGSTLYFLHQIADNTTVSYTDSAADSSISSNANPPTVSTADTLDELAGFVVFAKPPVTTYAAVTPTGSTQAGAAAVVSEYNLCNTTSASTGVILPALNANLIGLKIVVRNSNGTNALAVYPPVGGTINSGSANASVSVATTTTTTFVATSSSNYVTF